MTPVLAVPKPRSEEWWLRQWQAEQKVWPISRGQGVTVAVIDSGVDATLPDLKGAVLPGGDILGGGTDGRTDLIPSRHGTGMASLIAGRGYGTRMVGVAPASKILPVRATDETNGAAKPETMAKAIRWAVDHGAKVISMSMGTDSETELECEPERQHAVDYALDHDVVIVASAGNSGHQGNPRTQPAGCPGVLAVGAVDRQGNPAFFTQRQPYVAVAAPGVNVGSERGVGYFDTENRGTSSAGALTAGVVALVRAKYPQMSARDVVRRVTATARDVGPKGQDDTTGFGALRPLEALTASVPPNAANPVFERWDRSRRERVLQPLPSNAPEAVPDVVPLRTRMIQVGSALAAFLMLATGAAGCFLVFRRRSRRRRRERIEPQPYQWPGVDYRTEPPSSEESAK